MKLNIMDSNEIKNNGWSEYKMLVLKELEFLTIQITELTKNLVILDKEQAKSALKIEEINKNTITATASLDKKLEIINEFGQALKEQANKHITSEEFNKVIEDIKHLREAKATLEGKASMTSVYVGYIIALVALGISILRIFI